PGQFVAAYWSGMSLLLLFPWLIITLLVLSLTPFSSTSALPWCFLLLLEAHIMSCIALALALNLRHFLPAVLSFSCFYLLFRWMTDFLTAANSSLGQMNDFTSPVLSGFLQALAFISPRLDLYADSRWLISSTSPALLYPLLQTWGIVAIFLLLSTKTVSSK